MASSESDARMAQWKDSWEKDDIPFHYSNVNKVLQKYLDQLVPEGQGHKIFVPLCGKTVDMKWLADKGRHVVGLDGVKKALEEFYKDQKLTWTEKAASNMGDGCLVLEGTDSTIKLYCGDIMDFNTSVEGQFDAVWDRGSLVALERGDIPKYVQLIKSILKPGGKILVEVFEYDKALMSGPPHAMHESDMKSLFEPECTVQFLEKDDIEIYKVKAHTAYYLLSKL